MQAHDVAAFTMAGYDRMAVAYRRGTADHDDSQNIATLLEAIEGEMGKATRNPQVGPRDSNRKPQQT